ncbi:Fc.00g096100.m01.CDS01 [Cosmosporella sp. VM-42]
MLAVRGRQYLVVAFVLTTVLMLSLFFAEESRIQAKQYFDKLVKPNPEGTEKTENPENPEKPPPVPKYLPMPTWVPPPVKDPFPLLATSTPPPIPEWNVPEKDLHKKYDLDYAPPLLIGFTRTWPLLLQAVVSYITAGWPAEQIYVVENTGVQRANLEGKLTLQNPFYFNHARLKKLGVNIVRTPVLMNFAQLQNFYVHLAYENDWPHYFWSHMDVLVLSYEAGEEGLTPPATEDGYKSLYELCLTSLNDTLHADKHWANRFFAYDHLALVNREAYAAVGGWDTFIPYYITDCDMHSRLLMDKWTQIGAKAGHVHDVNTALDDLLVLYRNTNTTPSFTDPNPPPSSESSEKHKRNDDNEPESLKYWRRLQEEGHKMSNYKHSDRGRNTWQVAQQGGAGEPYYYPARGVAEAIDVLTEAGKDVYRRKWGHRDCDLETGAGLKIADQWMVKADWE